MSDPIATLGCIGKYQILRQIGQGGMGTVYAALDPTLNREIAIKVIRESKAWKPRAIERFKREAQALAKINNPHVVHIYEFAPEEADPYLVMELVRGRPLSVELRRNGAFDLRRFCDCAWQVLEGLAVAHKAKVIHRDLKPSNILLSEDGVYKILDFGLARDRQQVSNLTGDSILGTCRYLSPEQARGEEATTASDLYSLGSTFYELLTGNTPFDDENTLALVNMIGNEPVPPIIDKRDGIPTALAAWIHTLTAFDPQDRFPSASKARKALDAIADEITGTGVYRKDINPTDPTRSIDPTQAVTSEPGTHEPATKRVTPKRPPTSRTHVIETLRPAEERRDESRSGLPTFQKPRFSFFMKMLLIMWLLSSAATFIVGHFISEHSLQIQLQKWRSDLKATAASATLLIDGDQHEALWQSGKDDHPYFAEVVERLGRFRETNPDIKYIYTMTKTDESAKVNQVFFVVDASAETDDNNNGRIDDDEENAVFGDRYETDDVPMLLKGFNGPTADEEMARDQWGTFLSGYAPIRNSSGESVAIVGVDVTAEHIDELAADFRIRSWLMQIATLVAFLAAAAIVAIRLNRPMATLHHTLREVAKGNYQIKAPVDGRDEFAQFAVIINHMIQGLRERDSVRKAFDGFIAREISEHVLKEESREFGGQALYLYCQVLVDGDGEDLGTELLEELLPRLLASVHTYGGVADRVIGGGFVAMFSGPNALPELTENGIRCALAMQHLAVNHPECRLGIGLMANNDGDGGETVNAVTMLGDLNPELGTDILCCAETFASVRHMFIADRLQDQELFPGQRCGVVAIKAAVAG